MRMSHNGASITSMESWFTHARPKGGLKQWVDGRSAKELAKAFLEQGAPAEPPELHALLSSAAALGRVRLREGWPEQTIRLDSFRGETRNADMAALGAGNCGLIAVTIEAKADETFGETIDTALSTASKRSNVPHRIAALTKALFNKPASEILPLRYQLLHAMAATLIFADEQHAVAAIFVVFEFQSRTCSSRRLAQNAADLTTFIHVLSPDAAPLRVGALLGPFTVPGGDRVPSHIPLYVGKAVRVLDEPLPPGSSLGWRAAKRYSPD